MNLYREREERRLKSLQKRELTTNGNEALTGVYKSSASFLQLLICILLVLYLKCVFYMSIVHCPKVSYMPLFSQSDGSCPFENFLDLSNSSWLVGKCDNIHPCSVDGSRSAPPRLEPPERPPALPKQQPPTTVKPDALPLVNQDGEEDLSYQSTLLQMRVVGECIHAFY